MATCPQGHESTTSDYCDTCGTPIEAPRDPTVTLPAVEEPAAAPLPPCPACGEPIRGRFCESCGYDPEAGEPVAASTVTLELTADRAHWDRMVGSGEPAFPTALPALRFELTGDRVTLGRARPGSPEPIDLALTGVAADPAVSHHHCVFERQGAQWVVRDAGSANGTWINDATRPLPPDRTHALADGDRILIGAWTRLTVRVTGSGS